MSDEEKKPDTFGFDIGGEYVDFSRLAPLTVGDKKALKSEGVDFMKYARERGAIDPDDESKLVLYMIRKSRPATTMEDVDKLPALIASSFLQFAMKRATEIDDPFSTRSTTSVPPTGGASAKSEIEPTKSL